MIVPEDESSCRYATRPINGQAALLSLWRYRKLRDDLTIHDFYFALARLGGHQNRKRDGHPGWLVLWRVWTKPQSMLDGYDAAKRIKCGKT